MVWLLKLCLFLAFAAGSPALMSGQEQELAPEPNTEFISGPVTDLSGGRIVINRAVLGKPPENRSFLVKPETKIEGRLRVNARVTVGFKPSEEGDVAVRIIVRAQQDDKKR
jgi:hypothetical protein